MSQTAKILNFPNRHLTRKGLAREALTPESLTTESLATESLATEQDARSAGASFACQFQARAERYSPFCLGIDPSDKVLRDRSLADTCADWSEQIIKEGVAVVKPQVAYFERFGSQGIKVLEVLTQTLRQEGVLVLLDVKRGDIEQTNCAYAEAYFGEKSALCADAITTSAYLGFDELKPFFEAGYVFVVAASSNEAGLKSPYQQGASLAHLIDKIATESNAGAVIGATRKDISAKTLAPLADSLLLCPGIGAQGAGFEVFEKFSNKHNVIPTASRSVLEADNFVESLKQHKALAAKQLR